MKISIFALIVVALFFAGVAYKIVNELPNPERQREEQYTQCVIQKYKMYPITRYKQQGKYSLCDIIYL